jgi:hypothetical protein
MVTLVPRFKILFESIIVTRVDWDQQSSAGSEWEESAPGSNNGTPLSQPVTEQGVVQEQSEAFDGAGPDEPLGAEDLGAGGEAKAAPEVFDTEPEEGWHC